MSNEDLQRCKCEKNGKKPKFRATVSSFGQMSMGSGRGIAKRCINCGVTITVNKKRKNNRYNGYNI